LRARGAALLRRLSRGIAVPTNRNFFEYHAYKMRKIFCLLFPTRVNSGLFGNDKRKFKLVLNWWQLHKPGVFLSAPHLRRTGVRYPISIGWLNNSSRPLHFRSASWRHRTNSPNGKLGYEDHYNGGLIPLSFSSTTMALADTDITPRVSEVGKKKPSDARLPPNEVPATIMLQNDESEVSKSRLQQISDIFTIVRISKWST
jgi:hypothetical protein